MRPAPIAKFARERQGRMPHRIFTQFMAADVTLASIVNVPAWCMGAISALPSLAQTIGGGL
jgi:hypothetical protein